VPGEEEIVRIVTLMLAALFGCGAAAVLAQEPAPLLQPAEPQSTPATRWSFKRVDNGFIRLDNETGHVAHCTSSRTAGWTCQAVPEDRAALEKQIARLQDEVATLKKEIAQLRAPPPPPPPPEKGPGVSLRIPTQEEIAGARDYLAGTLTDTWQRLVQMIARLQRDILHNG
jgi:flagellar biosynthesis/type III secretory pathway chaperone